MIDKNKTILIIEDDVDMIEAVKLILQPTHYRVLESHDPEDGLNKAKAEKPDLIILDVMFGSKGESQGFHYAVKMKADKSLAPIPILMMTSVNAKVSGYKFSDESDGEYLPVDDFVDKPVQPEDLLQRVEKLITQKTSIWSDYPVKR
ncbi:MAG: response regulator [Elusimicrobia bacterium]|nr:response regulator [Candidatus Obscuribacterium magneticum]